MQKKYSLFQKYEQLAKSFFTKEEVDFFCSFINNQVHIDFHEKLSNTSLLNLYSQAIEIINNFELGKYDEIQSLRAERLLCHYLSFHNDEFWDSCLARAKDINHNPYHLKPSKSDNKDQIYKHILDKQKKDYRNRNKQTKEPESLL